MRHHTRAPHKGNRHHRGKSSLKSSALIASQLKKKLVEVDESNNLENIISEVRVGQELLGLTDGQLREMYDNAMQLLEAQQCEGAIRGFSLLAQLHPYISDFWLGLGAARMLSGQPEKALSAYLMAETMDCHRADIISALVDCYFELHDPKGALNVLKRAHKHLLDESITPEDRRSLERELIRLDRLVENQIHTSSSSK